MSRQQRQQQGPAAAAASSRGRRAPARLKIHGMPGSQSRRTTDEVKHRVAVSRIGGGTISMAGHSDESLLPPRIVGPFSRPDDRT